MRDDKEHDCADHHGNGNAIGLVTALGGEAHEVGCPQKRKRPFGRAHEDRARKRRREEPRQQGARKADGTAKHGNG